MSETRKNKIEEDLKKNPNDPRYTFTKPNNSKSTVWDEFKIINYEGDAEEFARCNKCQRVLAHSAKIGTSSLIRHKCKVQRNVETNQSTITTFVGRKVPANVKEEIIKSQVNFISKDLRPLCITEGAGFQALAQKLIDVGATYGRQNVGSLLVSRRTLTSEAIPKEYNNLKKALEAELAENHLAFTTDMWTDEYTQRSFLTLTTHFVNDKYELKTYVLGTREFKDEKKTGINIHDFVLEILTDFKIESKLKSSVFVTDNGANVVCAFKHYKRVSCSCHNLNLVMGDVLEKKKINDIEILIESCKTLVTHFKRAELNMKLSKSLKQHVKTRWNSLLTMFISIFEVKNEIDKVLAEKNELHRLYCINFVLLEDLINFLTPFKVCSEKLSADLVPTIHEVSLCYGKLFKTCEPNPTDSEIIVTLKFMTKDALMKKFKPCDLHNIATFLNPPFKGLNFLNQEERSAVINSMRTLLEDKERNEIRKYNLDADDGPSTSKKAKSIEYFQEFVDENGDNVVENHVECELEIYQRKIINNFEDVLSFWKNATDLPNLRTVARTILCIPASSASSERVFSTSGRILEERRTRLLGENLDKILFLNKNIK